MFNIKYKQVSNTNKVNNNDREIRNKNNKNMNFPDGVDKLRGSLKGGGGVGKVQNTKWSYVSSGGDDEYMGTFRKLNLGPIIQKISKHFGGNISPQKLYSVRLKSKYDDNKRFNPHQPSFSCLQIFDVLSNSSIHNQPDKGLGNDKGLHKAAANMISDINYLSKNNNNGNDRNGKDKYDNYNHNSNVYNNKHFINNKNTSTNNINSHKMWKK